MKHLLTCLLFVLCFNSFSQEDATKEKIINNYIVELNLNQKQVMIFSEIIDKYHDTLKDAKLTDNEFNKINKQRGLEIYKVLNKNQFAVYKRLQKDIEPDLNYRFD